MGVQTAYAKCLISLACLATLGGTSAKAQELKTVFVIAMENHNRTQPASPYISQGCSETTVIVKAASQSPERGAR